jgi:membrane-associated phospholipid phosphatase
MGFEKLILDMNICALLKHNVDRSRPNDSNNDSFTSGHTTPPASFASTVSTMSDWNPWVTGISYGISIFTGFCRIERDQHWFSDIVASHVLTTLTAIPMSKYWKSKNVVILPDVNDARKGIIAVFTF